MEEIVCIEGRTGTAVLRATIQATRGSISDFAERVAFGVCRVSPFSQSFDAMFIAIDRSIEVEMGQFDSEY
jgi:hypothetical protein